MTALPGAGGITAAWKMRVATGDGLGSALAPPGGTDQSNVLGKTALDGAIPPYSIPDVRSKPFRSTVPFAAGYMRGSPAARDDLLHRELHRRARPRGGDRAARIPHGDARRQPAARALPPGRGAAGGWDGGGARQHAGDRRCSAFGSHIGLVANATIGADQRQRSTGWSPPSIAGRIVNPQLVRQQIEGGLIWALGLATVREPEWAAGMPRARPFGAIGLPRIGDTPEIQVQLIPSSAASGRRQRPGRPVLAPAVANAILPATGKRMRNLPFDPMAAA